MVHFDFIFSCGQHLSPQNNKTINVLLFCQCWSKGHDLEESKYPSFVLEYKNAALNKCIITQQII
jgi:hypothetical protein